MKCHHALEMLEVVMRPESAEMADPELAVAAAHLQVCPRCQDVVNNRQGMDRMIGAACRDIPVPAGLEDRLLDTVSAEFAPHAASRSADFTNESQPNSSRQPLSSRQRWKKLTTFSAASLLCLIAGWWFFAPASTITTTELASAAVKELVSSQSPERFQGSFDPEVLFPEDSIRASALGKMTPYRQLTISGSTVEVAASSFSFSNRRGREIRGALLIVPTGDVQPRPIASHISAAATVYQRGFSIKLWQSDGFVYACLVKGDAARFRRIQRDNGGRTT